MILESTYEISVSDPNNKYLIMAERVVEAVSHIFRRGVHPVDAMPFCESRCPQILGIITLTVVFE